jgi:hypothetical protein
MNSRILIDAAAPMIVFSRSIAGFFAVAAVFRQC